MLYEFLLNRLARRIAIGPMPAFAEIFVPCGPLTGRFDMGPKKAGDNDAVGALCRSDDGIVKLRIRPTSGQRLWP